MRAASAETMITRPALRSTMPGRISCRNSTGALMCTAWAAHQRSGSANQMGPKGPPTPALLTRRVVGPWAASAALTAAATLLASVTSAAAASASPPLALIPAATASS